MKRFSEINMDQDNVEWQVPVEGRFMPFKDEHPNANTEAQDDFAKQYPALTWLKWFQVICTILMLLAWGFVLIT